MLGIIFFFSLVLGQIKIDRSRQTPTRAKTERQRRNRKRYPADVIENEVVRCLAVAAAVEGTTFIVIGFFFLA